MVPYASGYCLQSGSEVGFLLGLKGHKSGWSHVAGGEFLLDCMIAVMHS